MLGTLNVLRSARRAGGVRRVVLTSSTAAILPFHPPADAGRVWNEDSWNLDTTLSDNAYRYSKTLAEQAAWVWMASAYNSHESGCAGAFTSPDEIKAALDTGGQVGRPHRTPSYAPLLQPHVAPARLQVYPVSFDLVVINPSLIIGPPLSARVDGTSAKIIKARARPPREACAPLERCASLKTLHLSERVRLLREEGAARADRIALSGARAWQGILEGSARGGVALGVVDVRDAAEAHVRAMTTPDAFGR